MLVKSISIPWVLKQKIKLLEQSTSGAIVSNTPPEGYKEVTKIYVNLETGILLVEHKL